MSPLAAGHLGDLAAALVDDQLDPATRDLALSHLAGCPQCQVDVDAQRRLKARLRGLGGPGLPASLASRLSALPESGGSGPGEPPAQLRPSDPARPLAHRAPRQLRGRPASRPSLLGSHRAQRLLAGAASLALLSVGAAFAAAGDAGTGTPTRPVAVSFSGGSAASPAPGSALAAQPVSEPVVPMSATMMPASWGTTSVSGSLSR